MRSEMRLEWFSELLVLEESFGSEWPSAVSVRDVFAHSIS